MGAGCSRPGRQRKRQRQQDGNPTQPSRQGAADAGAAADAVHDAPLQPLQLDWERHQQAALERLRDEFKNKPRVFIISQMIMAVHFFRNFDRDRLRALKLKEEREEELNRILHKDHKSAIYLGSPYELMGEVMRYERSAESGPALGHDLEYLILHDNVSVRSRFEPENDSDSATYKFVMIPSRNPGYARLQQCGDSPPDSSSRAADTSCQRGRPRDQTRSVRSLSGSDRDPPTRSDHPEDPAVLRRSKSEDVLGDAAERGAGGDAVSRRHGDSSADTADSSRRGLAARPRSAGPSDLGRARASDEASESSLPSSAQRDSTSTQADGEDKETKARPKPAPRQARKQGVTAQPASDSDAKTDSGIDLTLPTHRDANSRANSSDSSASGDAVRVDPASRRQNDQGPAAPPFGWLPYPSPYPAEAPYPAQYMMVAPFAYPMFPQALPTGEAAGYQALPGHFVQPMYVPAQGAPQSAHPLAGPGFPYLAFPSAPLLYAYPPPLAGGASSASVGQVASVFPGHFAARPSGDRHNGLETVSESPSADVEQTTADIFLKVPTAAKAAEAGWRRRKVSRDDALKPDPRRKRSLSDSLRPEGASTCSDDSHGSFVNLVDTTTDEDPEAPGHLPRHCFRKFRVRVDIDDDDEDSWSEPRYEIHRYLSSEIFVNLFTDHFSELARLMARDVWVQQASANFLRGPTMHCREQLPSGLHTTALVTPTVVTSSWPEAALAWGLRERPKLMDHTQRVRYQWPPERVVQELRQEGFCNLVPQGCFVREPLRAARHFSPQAMAVEWELCFQQAEMRLISSLEAVHVHCWAVAKLFFTHFLSEFSCIKERHIRHLIFWQFERNIRDWRLEALGGPLVELLRRLGQCVRQRQLPHYFVPDRNLLESEAPRSLLSAQERIQRAMENGVPNILIALSRLRVCDDAFPEFDWAQLYHYLTAKQTELLLEMNPALTDVSRKETDSPTSGPGRDQDNDEDAMFVPSKEAKRERLRQRHLRQQAAAAAAAAAARHHKRLPRRRPLPAFADASVQLHHLNDGFLPRARLVLAMFVRHFAAMAARLLDHGAVEPALAYADHGLNLCQLLEEHVGSEEAEEGRRELLGLHARAAELLSPFEADRPTDADLLGCGGQSSSGGSDNWTLGQAAGRAARRDYNRQVTAGSEVGPEPGDQGEEGRQSEAPADEKSTDSEESMLGGEEEQYVKQPAERLL